MRVGVCAHLRVCVCVCERISVFQDGLSQISDVSVVGNMFVTAPVKGRWRGGAEMTLLVLLGAKSQPPQLCTCVAACHSVCVCVCVYVCVCADALVLQERFRCCPQDNKPNVL